MVAGTHCRKFMASTMARDGCDREIPFALSLSKGCPSPFRRSKEEERGFDKLSPNGEGCRS